MLPPAIESVTARAARPVPVGRLAPFGVPQILAVAFAVRLAVGLATDSVLFPDEVYQYLEQAHRLVFGAGMIPWEYEYGNRSWVVPLAIAAVLKPLQLLGLDSPRIYQPAVEAALCAISLVLPYSVYRITQHVLTERVARLALIFTAVWYELVAYGHRATIDALAAYAAVGAVALCLVVRRPRGVLACGMVAGLTIVLRFQLAPMVGIIALLVLWRWRRGAWPWIVGFLVVLVAGGALDYYTWGVWFSSILTYVNLVLSDDVVTRVGGTAAPFYAYVLALLVLSGGLIVAGVWGLVVTWRSTWPLAAIGTATLVAFSAIGHKDPRFVFLLIPLWLIGLAAVVDTYSHRIAGTVPRSPHVESWLRRAAIVLVVVVSAFGLFNRLPNQDYLMQPVIARNDVRDAYRRLADDTDVFALLDVSGSEPWFLAPYYDLHHDVPLYLPLNDGFSAAKGDPERYASHVVANAGAPAPKGFRRLETVGEVAIWRRITDPAVTVPPIGYTSRISALRPVRHAPTVTPRW
jgi:hypothetical protein